MAKSLSTMTSGISASPPASASAADESPSSLSSDTPETSIPSPIHHNNADDKTTNMQQQQQPLTLEIPPHNLSISHLQKQDASLNTTGSEASDLNSSTSKVRIEFQAASPPDCDNSTAVSQNQTTAPNQQQLRHHLSSSSSATPKSLLRQKLIRDYPQRETNEISHSYHSFRDDALYLRTRLLGHSLIKAVKRDQKASKSDNTTNRNPFARRSSSASSGLAYKSRNYNDLPSYNEWRQFLLNRANSSMHASTSSIVALAEFKRERTNMPGSTPTSSLLKPSYSASKLDTSSFDPITDELSFSRTSMDEVSSIGVDEDTLSSRVSQDSSTAGEQTRIPKYLAPTTVHEAYSFAGIHHLFEDKGKIYRLKFANFETGKVAWSTSRGLLVIAQLNGEDGPKKLFICKGHKKAILDFDWSMTNDYIVTVALDSLIKLWDTSTGKCLRTINAQQPLRCCAFHPQNNNRFLVGFHRSNVLCWYNTSTGLPIKKFKLKNAVTAMCFTPQGDVLLLGDASSYLYAYTYDATLKMRRRFALCIDTSNKKPITSISFSSYERFARERANLILINNTSDSVKLFRLDKDSFKLSFKSQFPIKHSSSLPIRSTFCPIISMRMGAVFLTGCESSVVKVFDLTQDSSSKQFLTQLSAHTAPVLDVAWNANETILGSCDSKGTILFWKREKSTDSKGS